MMWTFHSETSMKEMGDKISKLVFSVMYSAEVWLKIISEEARCVSIKSSRYQVFLVQNQVFFRHSARKHSLWKPKKEEFRTEKTFTLCFSQECKFSYPYLLFISTNTLPHRLQLHCSQCQMLCIHKVYESISISYLFIILFIFYWYCFL